jgi:hypothetical protein
MEPDLRSLAGPVKVENTFQVNKWLRFSLAAAIVLLGAFIGWGATYDWTQVVSVETAGKIVFVFGLLKTAYTAFAPSSGSGSLPTDSYIVTQRGITKV